MLNDLDHHPDTMSLRKQSGTPTLTKRMEGWAEHVMFGRKEDQEIR